MPDCWDEVGEGGVSLWGGVSGLGSTYGSVESAVVEMCVVMCTETAVVKEVNARL